MNPFSRSQFCTVRVKVENLKAPANVAWVGSHKSLISKKLPLRRVAMPTRRYLIALGAASAFASSLVGAAPENAWPNRPVHMIVPFAAGGPTDIYARIVAEQLSTIWGQQVVIDNKGGAGSNIGNAFVAHSGPDGYTRRLSSRQPASKSTRPWPPR